MHIVKQTNNNIRPIFRWREQLTVKNFQSSNLNRFDQYWLTATELRLTSNCLDSPLPDFSYNILSVTPFTLLPPFFTFFSFQIDLSNLISHIARIHPPLRDSIARAIETLQQVHIQRALESGERGQSANFSVLERIEEVNICSIDLHQKLRERVKYGEPVARHVQNLQRNRSCKSREVLDTIATENELTETRHWGLQWYFISLS